MNCGEIIEVDSDDDDNENMGNLTNQEMIGLCEQLEKASLNSSADCILEVSRVLRRFQAELTQLAFRGAKQTTLTSFWEQRPKSCHKLSQV